MAKLNVRTAPIVPKGQVYPPGVGAAPALLRALGYPWAQALAASLSNIDGALTQINGTLRKAAPVTDSIVVVDENSKVVAALGPLAYGGVVTNNYFSEIHAGDPLGTGDPAEALFNANADGSVVIGQNGWITVHDPYGAEAAWIGTQWDTLAVTLAANNGSGLIRLTVAGHPFATSDVLLIRDVGGVPNATGQFTITKIDANRFDLQASVWDGTYTSGGTVTRLLHVTGAVNNGAGLIRLTVTAHGCETGDRANVGLVGGVPNATGQWTLTVIGANTIDLIGSTWGGTYTTGGTFIRYFAGMMAQTFSIGAFTNYKLRAFADGNLKIKNASIILTSGGSTIEIDPDGSGIARVRVSGLTGGGHAVALTMYPVGLTAIDATTGEYITLTADSIFRVGTHTISITGLQLTIPEAAATLRSLELTGSTSGSVSFVVPAVAGSAVYTLPSADGSAGYVLKTDGSGVLSFGAAYLPSGTDVAVTDGGTGTSTGSITGTGALTFAAGGSGQNVTLTPSGSGYTILNGDVGIGKTNPGYKLDVNGTIGAGNGAIILATSTTSYFAGTQTAKITVGGAAIADSQYGIDIFPFAGETGSLRVTHESIFGGSEKGITFQAHPADDNGNVTLESFPYTLPSGPSGTGNLALDSMYGDIIFGTNRVEKMRLLYGGNVGIGLVAPGYKVDVLGDINTSTLFRVAGTQVVGARQADPGVPVFVTFADVATWCGNLRNALKATTGHGLF